MFNALFSLQDEIILISVIARDVHRFNISVDGSYTLMFMTSCLLHVHDDPLLFD